MTTVVRALVSLILLVGLTLPTPNSVGLSPSTITSVAGIKPAANTLQLLDHISWGGEPTLEDRALTQRAVGLFAEAGLTLPVLEVVFHTTTDGCLNKNGLHRLEGNRHSVEICEPRPRTVVHELAHAWLAHNLGQAEIEAFLRLRRLEVWNSSEIGWTKRGVEHAAEIITWGLIDAPIGIPLPANDCDSLLAGYLQLVGAEPPHGLTAHCESPLDFRYHG